MPSKGSYVEVTTDITLDGPFFRNNPGNTLYTNIGLMLDALAEEMEGLVKQQVAEHEGDMPYWSGWSLRNVKGYRAWNKHWATWAAVSAYTKGMNREDAIRTKAKMAGRHQQGNSRGVTRGIEERWHPFRRVLSGLYRARAINRANLAKNLE